MIHLEHCVAHGRGGARLNIVLIDMLSVAARFFFGTRVPFVNRFTINLVA